MTGISGPAAYALGLLSALLRFASIFRRHRVSFVFQTFNLFPAHTALENVEFGADVAGRGDPVSVARETLDRAGLGPTPRCSPTGSRRPASSAAAWSRRS